MCLTHVKKSFFLFLTQEGGDLELFFFLFLWGIFTYDAIFLFLPNFDTLMINLFGLIYAASHSVTSKNCELKERIHRAIRELPIVEELKNSHRIHGGVSGSGATTSTLHNKRSTSFKRRSRDTIPQLAKNIESFLQKLIPNHGLVQDLMGYVTMPNPNVNNRYHHHHLQHY